MKLFNIADLDELVGAATRRILELVLDIDGRDDEAGRCGSRGHEADLHLTLLRSRGRSGRRRSLGTGFCNDGRIIGLHRCRSCTPGILGLPEGRNLGIAHRSPNDGRLECGGSAHIRASVLGLVELADEIGDDARAVLLRALVTGPISLAKHGRDGDGADDADDGEHQQQFDEGEARLLLHLELIVAMADTCVSSPVPGGLCFHSVSR